MAYGLLERWQHWRETFSGVLQTKEQLSDRELRDGFSAIMGCNNCEAAIAGTGYVAWQYVILSEQATAFECRVKPEFANGRSFPCQNCHLNLG